MKRSTTLVLLQAAIERGKHLSRSLTLRFNVEESDAERLLASVWRVLEEHDLATPLLTVRSANRSIDVTLTFQSSGDQSSGDCAAVKAELAANEIQMRAFVDTANQQETRIKRWRQKAEELRAVADQFASPSAQQTMRRVAADYEKLADDGEARISGRPLASDEKAG